MDLDVSIIIPTYNGREKIRFTLGAIFGQTVKPQEIIVVIDGSRDGTEEFLKQEYGDLIKIIYQENKGRASTRNTGAKRAKGSLLIFVDDDIELESDAVQKHLHHHQSNNRSFLVGALFLKDVPIGSDFHSYRQSIEKSWYSNLPGYPETMQADRLFVSAANLSVPGYLFDELNGFDGKLRDCEDFELGIRALQAGVDIYFSEAIRGCHNDLLSCQQYVQRRRAYEEAHVFLMDTNQITKPFQGKEKPGIMKKIIYYLLSFDFWVKWIDNNVLNWIPRLVRYKLYSAVIWSKSHYYRSTST